MSGAASTILFNSIPISQIRVPGTYIEVDPQGGSGAQQFNVLVVGQMTSAGAATANQPLICSGVGDPDIQAGPGSMLSLMAKRYIAQDTFGPLVYLPLADDPGATTATLSWLYAGTATGAGTHALRIGGVLVPIAVSVGMTAAQLASAVVAAVAANIYLPVTSAITTGTSGAGVTVTAKNKGLAAADVDVRVNYLGTPGGEVSPPGITVTGILQTNGTGTQLTGGTQNPTALAAALANLGNRKFNLIIQPYNDTASRTAFQSYMNATAGRWSYLQMLYGQGIGSLRGTFSALTTFGLTRNDPAMSTTGLFDSPDSSYVVAADIAANVAISARNNPAIPLHDIPVGVMAPPAAELFAYGASNTLLFDGISTLKFDQSGQGYIQQIITEYQTNSQGAPDTSFLKVNTRLQLDYVCTDLKNYCNTNFVAARKILVSDATKVSVTSGSPLITPSIAKSMIIARYYYLQSLGIVQNADAFAQAVVVTIAAPGVLGISWPGDLSNQLDDVAIQVAFTQT